MRASGESGALMLHVDATFKLNQVGYPVIVVGVSDRARAFHLVALFVSSQRTEVHYRKVFAALSSIHRQVLGKPLEVHLVMGDADVAQLNGIRQGLEQGAQVKYVVCFYHVIAKVFEKTRGLLPSHANAVMSGVYDMHCALDESAFTETKTRVLAAWAEIPELATFSAYFQTQWLSGRFTNWQIFHTPRGWATTNNPVEQYNRTIKRQYTLHSRLKMGALLGQFLTCCTAESVSGKAFTVEPAIPTSTLRRTKELSAAKMLREYSLSRASIAFVLGDDEEKPADVVRVILKPFPRIFDPEIGRTHEALMVTARLGVHFARMEVQGMPNDGWHVNTAMRTCGCIFFQKYAACIHLVHALSARGLLSTSKRPTLVYRGPNKARRLMSEAQASGRPA